MTEIDTSSSRYFETIFTRARQNSILLLNDKGIIIAINDCFTKCFGYTERDIIGQKTTVLFTEEDQKKGLPGKELNTVIREGQCADNNFLVREKINLSHGYQVNHYGLKMIKAT